VSASSFSGPRGLLFVAGLLAAPLAAAAGSAQAGVVFSDGFEAPVVNHTGPSGSAGGYDNYGTGAAIGPWTVVAPPGRTDAVSVVTTDFAQNGITFPAQSGKQWADLAGQDANGNEGVRTTVIGLAGLSYTVSFWVGNVVDPNGVFGSSTTVNLLVDGVQVFSAVNDEGGPSTLTWQRFTYSGMGASNSTVFTFLSGDPASDFSSAFDNVVITTDGVGGVPEPATWALMLGGFGLAGAALRARRRRVLGA